MSGREHSIPEQSEVQDQRQRPRMHLIDQVTLPVIASVEDKRLANIGGDMFRAYWFGIRRAIYHKRFTFKFFCNWTHAALTVLWRRSV